MSVADVLYFETDDAHKLCHRKLVALNACAEKAERTSSTVGVP